MIDKEIIAAIVIAVFGSTGFWAVVQQIINDRQRKKRGTEKEDDSVKKAVLAILHHDLRKICDEVIEQQYITEAQYEDIIYMAGPYSDLGGDGTVEKKVEQSISFDMKG